MCIRDRGTKQHAQSISNILNCDALGYSNQPITLLSVLICDGRPLLGSSAILILLIAQCRTLIMFITASTQTVYWWLWIPLGVNHLCQKVNDSSLLQPQVHSSSLNAKERNILVGHLYNIVHRHSVSSPTDQTSQSQRHYFLFDPN